MTSGTSAFKWSDFYELASRLKAGMPDNSVSEAVRRTVVGRAYYAAFLCARDMSNPAHFGAAHVEVINFFDRQTDKALRRIGNKLKNLKSCRHNADYDPRYCSLGEVEKALKLSRDILEDLKVATGS